MYLIACFCIVSAALTIHAAPHQTKLNYDNIRTSFDVDSRVNDIDGVMTSSSRQKRDVDLDDISALTIELVVMVDSTVFDFFDSSKTIVENYVLHFVKALDLLMTNPSFGTYNLNIELLNIHYFNDSHYDPTEVTSQTDQCDDGEACIGQLNLMRDMWERINTEYQADHGLYLTKRKLCFGGMTGCMQSGYAPLGGMCGGRSSISIGRADGLSATSEVAHEIGHNMGIKHDGADIEACYDSMNIMSVSQTATVGNDFKWSTCSAKQFAENLRKGKMTCLNNNDGNYISVPTGLPGTELNYNEQCVMRYGLQADGNCNQNKQSQFSCKNLYCRQDTSKQQCIQEYPPAEGTPCNTESNDGSDIYDGWCRIGECLATGTEPEIEVGEWSEWAEGECSVTCGGGVKKFSRSCDANEGEQYCKGSDTKYELCNTELCNGKCSDVAAVDFRNEKCSKNNARFRKNEPCDLYCGSAYEMKVPDGGRQTDDPGKRANLDICVDGNPVTVGCDRSFTSGLVYDNCGVCGGDGGTCTLIQKVFNETFPKNPAVLVSIANLTAGTTHISFSETVNVKSSYFVLQGRDGTYLTNSDYTVRPEFTNTGVVGPFRYEYDCDTIFTHYHPTGDDEVERVVAPGPISEAIEVKYYMKKPSKFQPIEYSYYDPLDEQVATDEATQDNENDYEDQEADQDVPNEVEDDTETLNDETEEVQTEQVQIANQNEDVEETNGEDQAVDERPEETEDADQNVTDEGEDETGNNENELQAEEFQTTDQDEEDAEETGGSCTDMTYVGAMMKNQEQCTAKNGKRGATDWSYRLRANDPCNLYCYSEQKQELTSFNGGVEEGTWCSKDIDQLKRCVAGTCREVGCSSSNQAFDNCGICGGDDSTCELVFGSVELSEAVTSITTFPVGATYINVWEATDSSGTYTKYAKGYYILEAEDGTYLTGEDDNGTPLEPADVTGKSYDYTLGCTAFQHSKVLYESETIKSDSVPLSQPLHLKYQYKSQKNSRYVVYKYYDQN